MAEQTQVELTAEDVDRALSDVMSQTEAAHALMWTATASALVTRDPNLADELIAWLSYSTLYAQQHQKGPYFWAIVRSAMSDIAKVKYGENIPPEINSIIMGEVPPVQEIVCNGRTVAKWQPYAEEKR